MNKSEVLIYLQEKRKIIAPFEVAWRDKNLKQNQLKKAKKNGKFQ
ncbi:hypothetical protein AB6887_11670 [Carnobacterium divergens]|nr:hypothetical protein [Carnobacterium divergens]